MDKFHHVYLMFERDGSGSLELSTFGVVVLDLRNFNSLSD